MFRQSVAVPLSTIDECKGTALVLTMRVFLNIFCEFIYLIDLNQENIMFCERLIFLAVFFGVMFIFAPAQNTYYMQVQDIIRRYGLTQKEIARRMGITPVTLSNSIHKADNVNLTTLRRIAAAVGCSIIEFFEDELSQPLKLPTRATHQCDPPERPANDTTAGVICPHCGKRITITISPTSDEQRTHQR